MMSIWSWLTLWGIVGLLATAHVERDDEHYTFSWRFDRGQPLKIFAAGPVAWLLLVMRWLP